VRLRGKMVDLIGVGVTENLDEAETVENIAVVIVDFASTMTMTMTIASVIASRGGQQQTPSRLLRVDFGMVANKAMHRIAFFQE